MIPLLLTVFIPFLGICVLAVIRSPRIAGWANVFFSAISFSASVLLVISILRQGPFTAYQFHLDSFNVYLVLLTTFIGLTTAVFSRRYMEDSLKQGQVTARRMQLYHSLYQGFMFTMLLALTTDNLGILWVAVEGATLTTVLLVSLHRTPESIEAAWKYFILCSVGIAEALFGTVLVYFAAQHTALPSDQGLSWDALYTVAHSLDPRVMTVAFVFLIIGYGTKVGLVPMHNWLPDAHSESPTPISALLSGLLLNVALYAVIRFKMLVDGALASSALPHLANYLLMGFGLLSFLVAGLFMQRQQDVKRLFAYSSIEHMGLITFGFGLGGPIATFAALLYMAAHSLTKSAIFTSVGHATHIAKTQAIDHIRGLIHTQPAVGWGLLIGVVAIAGLPPFGIFSSEFLLITVSIHHHPWAAALLIVGLIITFAGLFRHVQPMVYGLVPEGQQPVKANMLPVALHLALVLILGFAAPLFFTHWLEQAARFIVGGGVR